MKEIIIVILIFCVILWFQSTEDNKYNKIRKTTYEKYKYPIFVSSIVGLILSYSNYFCQMNSNNSLREIIPKKIKSNILDQQIYIDPSPF